MSTAVSAPMIDTVSVAPTSVPFHGNQEVEYESVDSGKTKTRPIEPTHIMLLPETHPVGMDLADLSRSTKI